MSRRSLLKHEEDYIRQSTLSESELVLMFRVQPHIVKNIKQGKEKKRSKEDEQTVIERQKEHRKEKLLKKLDREESKKMVAKIQLLKKKVYGDLI